MKTYYVTVNGFTIYRGHSTTFLAKRTIRVRAHTAVGAKLLAIVEYKSDPSISPFLADVIFADSRLFASAFAEEACIDCGHSVSTPILEGYRPVGGRCFFCHEAYEGGAL